MKVINNAIDKISKFWVKPKIQTDSSYRLMKYVLVCECEDGTLLHNCVTGELVLIECESGALINSLPMTYNNKMDKLINKHFLVPENNDDKKSVSQLRNIVKIMSTKRAITSYTILPTTTCNARCFYCYESDMEHHNMSEETAEQLVKYIKEKSGGKKVFINWFGGEPLLCVDRINQIVKGLKENGVEFTSTITTNGYLFSKELARHAKDEWNLTDSQITIDGTEEVYNKTKAYVNITGSPYKKVMENISYLLDNGIVVKMRINLSIYNFDDAKNLIDEIAKRFSERNLLMPYIALVYEDVGFNPVSYNNTDAMNLNIKKKELEDSIEEYGFGCLKNELPSLDTIFCMADNDRAVLINPKGETAMCEHYVFDSVSGTIFDDNKNTEMINSWKEMLEWDECSGCVIYPSCRILKKCPQSKKCIEIEKTQKIDKAKKSVFEFYISKKD